MHVDLLTSYDPGDADTGTYPDAKIKSLTWYRDDAVLEAVVTWGTWSDPTWTEGKYSKTYTLTDTPYANIVADVSEASEKSSDAIDRAVLDELEATKTELDGTVATGG